MQMMMMMNDGARALAADKEDGVRARRLMLEGVSDLGGLHSKPL